MSLTILCKCPIEGCLFHEHPVSADRKQIKNHILYDHSYQQKKETALRLGIHETNPYRLAEILTEFSIGEKIE